MRFPSRAQEKPQAEDSDLYFTSTQPALTCGVNMTSPPGFRHLLNLHFFQSRPSLCETLLLFTQGEEPSDVQVFLLPLSPSRKKDRHAWGEI